MTNYTDEEVIEFVKKTHKDFYNNEAEYTEEQIEEMSCYTFTDWCDFIAEAHDFKMTKFMKKYFDFKRLLEDEWYNSASNGGHEYYLVYEEYGKGLKHLSSENFELAFQFCWVVTIPTH
jgi:hypothetical protein